MTTGTQIFRSNDSLGAAATVTPHDTNELPHYSRWLWVGGAGSGALKVTTVDGFTVALAGVTVGWHRIAAKVIWSTGTDVTNIVAFW
jgi:hypothetical protein